MDRIGHVEKTDIQLLGTLEAAEVHLHGMEGLSTELTPLGCD